MALSICTPFQDICWKVSTGSKTRDRQIDGNDTYAAPPGKLLLATPSATLWEKYRIQNQPTGYDSLVIIGSFFVPMLYTAKNLSITI